MGDRRKCQTYTASPAEPGGLPVMLGAALQTKVLQNLAIAKGGEGRRHMHRAAARCGRPHLHRQEFE